MLLNFMSNALKFTNKDGCITVKIEILDHQIKAKLSEGSSPLINERTETILDLDEKEIDEYFVRNMDSLKKEQEVHDSINSGDERFV